MKIITVTYALAFHDYEGATLDAVRDRLANYLADGLHAEIVHNISGAERTVAIADPTSSDDRTIDEDPYEEWQWRVWNEPEFQD